MQPSAGYFVPQPSIDSEREITMSSGGGMHLRNLLDDAPDAEGGAHYPYFQVRENYSAPPTARETLYEDSSTEDETEPARYATQTMSRSASDVMNAKDGKAFRRLSPRSPAIDPTLHDPPSYREHSYPPSRHSPAYIIRDPVYPPYPSVLSFDHYSPHHASHPSRTKGHYSSVSDSVRGPWSPYNGIEYGQPLLGSRGYDDIRREKFGDDQSDTFYSRHGTSKYNAHSEKSLPYPNPLYRVDSPYQPPRSTSSTRQTSSITGRDTSYGLHARLS